MKLGIIVNHTIEEHSKLLSAFTTLYHKLKWDYSDNLCILHGGARGPLKVLLDAIQFNKITVKDVDLIKFATWSSISRHLDFHTGLFLYRNMQIIDNADQMLFVVTDTPNNETEMAMRYADEQGVDYLVLNIDQEFDSAAPIVLT